ncbi:NAD(P)/FAD-dependent oxidoreductase [Sinosporangium siamense]|uniref:NAD(P)/FAD-dependent oxidoreductase n=1 Tax=Sinosporangium siamense TaxID=1367973 RepID=UPI00194DFFE1|nr:NAD(P)/FAD-dependent oxidoreductase [Sinosporangium siamense]
MFDIAIVGGGPAGLTAAMTLSRSRFRVVVVESPAPPRNAMSHGMHGLVGMDGVSPGEYRARAWADLDKYGMAVRRAVTAAEIVERDGGFVIACEDGDRIGAGRVLLATGMVDVFPEVDGFRECWGKTVIHCPLCVGWENAGRSWGVVVSTAEQARAAAARFAPWSRDVVVFGDGTLTGARDLGVEVVPGPIARLHHAGGDLRAVELADGRVVPRGTLFWRPRQRQVPVVERLGPVLDEHGFVKVDQEQRTSVPGVFAAGDLTTDWQTVVTAVHAGASAAYWVQKDMRGSYAALGEGQPVEHVGEFARAGGEDAVSAVEKGARHGVA